MASTPEAPQAGQVQRQWLDFLTRRNREAAYGLFAATVVFAALAGWVGYKYKADYTTVATWSAILGLLCLGGGIFQIVRDDRDRPGAVDSTRKLVLTIGGLAGFATAVLGVLLAYQWREVFAAGLEEWRREWWRIARCLLALFGGLAVMFGSLQLARSDERTSPGLRRLVYGYNALLGLLILFAILGVINVLAYVPIRPFSVFSKQYDWTASRIYSLSSASVNLLSSLDKSVDVYVLLPLEGDVELQEIHTMFDNMRAVTDKLNIEYLSPDLNRKRVLDLEQKYQILEREGILLVYGDAHEFIRYNDLFANTTRNQPDEPQRFLFKGENAVVSKLSYLLEGKSKAVIYITQGHGELDMNSFDTAPDQGLGELKDRLQKGNYEVKDLKFGAGADKVPDDASVIIIPRPTLPFAEADLRALRTYMNPTSEAQKKGKLIVLMDVAVRPDGRMASSGLEGFLAEFGVQAENDRLVKLSRGGRPTELIIIPNPDTNNPIARAFLTSAGPQPFLMDDVRTVKPQQQQAAGRFRVDSILVSYFQQGIWSETNLKSDPVQKVSELRANPDQAEEFVRTKVSRTPISVAVAVSESKLPAGLPPGHPGTGEQQPRLVVFGDSGWVSNRSLVDERAGGKANYDLFASSLSWLRERPDLGTIADPKERTFFVLNATPERVSQMRWLPAPLLIVLVIGLGAGIWVVRRR